MSLCPYVKLRSHMELWGMHCTSSGPQNWGAPPYPSPRKPQLKTLCSLPRETRSGVLKGLQSQLGTGNSRGLGRWGIGKKSFYVVWKSYLPKPNHVPTSARVTLGCGGVGWGKSYISLVVFISEKVERFRCEGRDSKHRSASPPSKIQHLSYEALKSRSFCRRFANTDSASYPN